MIPSQTSLSNQVDTNLQFHDVRFQNGPGASKVPEWIDEGDTEPPRNHGTSPEAVLASLTFKDHFHCSKPPQYPSGQVQWIFLLAPSGVQTLTWLLNGMVLPDTT